MGKLLTLLIFFAIGLTVLFGRCTFLTGPFLGACEEEFEGSINEAMGERTIRLEETDPSFAWIGDWQTRQIASASFGAVKITNYSRNDTNKVDIPFNGTEVKLMFYTCSECGTIQIKVDGKDYPRIDSYELVSRRRVKHITNLPSGPHILSIYSK
jgi:hypothetical protein